jgi:phosphatidylglycerol:prolipoprotein diacylglycerol transferase
MYSLMVGLAMLSAVAVYLLQTRRAQGGPSLPILLASLIGGLVGAKAPYLLANARAFLAGARDPEVLFAGRTILGGMLGGIVAVRITKRQLGLRARKGDALVPAIGLGMAVGRLGCFFRGCCYGQVTRLPWGVDFGDGLHRHPTELYESAFGLLWFACTVGRPKGDRGVLFDLFVGSYFAFRFGLEFIRTETVVAWGLTGFQLVCLPAIAWSLFKLARSQPWPIRS